MKKGSKIFSLLLLTIMTFGYGLSVVNAVETTPDSTSPIESNDSLSYGVTVEKVEENTIEDTMVADVFVTVTSGTLDSINLSYTLTNATLVEVVAHNNYIMNHNSVDGTISVESAVGWTSADSKVAILRFTTKKIDTAQECGLEITVDGKDFQKVEWTPAAPANPKTGSMIPVAIIVGGALLVAVVYVNSKKNTKMYKI